MQLGARWRAGETPHRSVPAALHAAIADQEAAHPEARSWTLTWLEGRPRAELDGIVTLTLDARGEAAIEADALEEAGTEADAIPGASDDDDDWLR